MVTWCKYWISNSCYPELNQTDAITLFLLLKLKELKGLMGFQGTSIKQTKRKYDLWKVYKKRYFLRTAEINCPQLSCSQASLFSANELQWMYMLFILTWYWVANTTPLHPIIPLIFQKPSILHLNDWLSNPTKNWEFCTNNVQSNYTQKCLIVQ